MNNNDQIIDLFNSVNSSFSFIPLNQLPSNLVNKLFETINEYIKIMTDVIEADEKDGYRYVKTLDNTQLKTIISFHNNAIKLFQQVEMYESCSGIKKINDILENQLKTNIEKNNSSNS